MNKEEVIIGLEKLIAEAKEATAAQKIGYGDQYDTVLSDAHLSTLRSAVELIDNLELEVVASKPLYSRRQLESKIAALTEALEDIARGYSDGQTYSGTNCAEIARKALE